MWLLLGNDHYFNAGGIGTAAGGGNELYVVYTSGIEGVGDRGSGSCASIVEIPRSIGGALGEVLEGDGIARANAGCRSGD